jgi:hypothetical protein
VVTLLPIWRYEARWVRGQDSPRLPNRCADDLLSIIEQARLDMLERDYPHTMKCPLDNLYGMHVYLRLPLDHLFHSEHFALVGIKRLPAFGSDHFPILVEIAYVERLDQQQQGLVPDSKDMQWADEKAAEEG